jgi:hypothetical protein
MVPLLLLSTEVTLSIVTEGPELDDHKSANPSSASSLRVLAKEVVVDPEILAKSKFSSRYARYLW